MSPNEGIEKKKENNEEDVNMESQGGSGMRGIGGAASLPAVGIEAEATSSDSSFREYLNSVLKGNSEYMGSDTVYEDEKEESNGSTEPKGESSKYKGEGVCKSKEDPEEEEKELNKSENGQKEVEEENNKTELCLENNLLYITTYSTYPSQDKMASMP